MALKKNVKERPETSLAKPLISDELAFRIMNLAGQTGVSPPDLILKWVLQEETQIGFMQRNKGQMTKQAKASPDVTELKPVAQDKSTKIVRVNVLPDPGSPDYRKSIVRHVKRFKEEGMTFKKIADTFNQQNVSTVSETGKWYASSIANLLNSKK